jgi:TubC N-terminal docking domain
VSAAAILEACARKRIQLVVRGDNIRYRAPKGAVTGALRQEVERHRTDVIAALRLRAAVVHRTPNSWPEDWRERWEERAAILESDAGLDCTSAERTAAALLRAAFVPEVTP